MKLVVNNGRHGGPEFGISEATLGWGQGQADAHTKNEQHYVPRGGCC